jgi:hypothetical protein
MRIQIPRNRFAGWSGLFRLIGVSLEPEHPRLDACHFVAQLGSRWNRPVERATADV